MGESLSQELREFAFKEIDDPIKELDELAQKAKELEMIANCHKIIVEELGQAVISHALENYLKREVS